MFGRKRRKRGEDFCGVCTEQSRRSCVSTLASVCELEAMSLCFLYYDNYLYAFGRIKDLVMFQVTDSYVCFVHGILNVYLSIVIIIFKLNDILIPSLELKFK